MVHNLPNSDAEALVKIYREALALAAMYVEHHCVNGSEHANAIMALPLPSNEMKEDRPQSNLEQTWRLTDGLVNEITLYEVGKWPSFEAQSWACKVAKAVHNHCLNEGHIVVSQNSN